MRSRLGELGAHESPTLYNKGTEPLGVGEFFGEGIMAQKDIVFQFDYMVDEQFTIDDYFISGDSHHWVYFFLGVLRRGPIELGVRTAGAVLICVLGLLSIDCSRSSLGLIRGR